MDPDQTHDAQIRAQAVVREATIRTGVGSVEGAFRGNVRGRRKFFECAADNGLIKSNALLFLKIE